ncbi:MAG: YicC/YloC family endoribonuclease [Salipiger marinus]|uniref:YicC/YloC family endoribonuclease n=1 Tax=Salipiger marinus TaxID=555512 RepID=UPI00405A3E5B
MTGFAAQSGEFAGMRWLWEVRGVNGKGLDLRLRLPEWIEGLEPAVRAAIGARVARGNVQVTLKLQSGGDEGACDLDEAVLGRILPALRRIEAQAAAQGLVLRSSSAAEIIALRGVLATGTTVSDVAALREALMANFQSAMDQFAAMREGEGAALATVLEAQLDQISQLTRSAAEAVEARRDDQAEKLALALARVGDAAPGMDPTRVAQELALIAVKSDVTEELDRLEAHVGAARELLAAEGAVGRKLDFLMQEFNREANTLCAKSGFAALTQIGLTLKTVIDQMREQVQNVE